MVEALKGEAGTQHAAPSAIEVKMAIKDATWMKPAMTVEERVRKVKLSVRR